MSYQQRIAVAFVDVLILAQLCVSIYVANQDPENFTVLFFKYFMAMLIPTLIAAKVCIKRLRSKEPELSV